jgi:TolA-binding protein
MTVHFYAPLCTVIAAMAFMSLAQDQITYDPEKGIMIVDKKKGAKNATVSNPLLSKDKSGKNRKKGETINPVQMPMLPAPDANDLHVGRKKDPSSLYFTSGLEYFKNADFSHALQNFTYADSMDPKPVFMLWIGKTRRQLGEAEKMLSIMDEIVRKHPDCDVADDALLEIACYYQSVNDYDTAFLFFSRLEEQYPFGESYATGEKLIDIARECRKNMNGELSSMLAIAGYPNEELAGAISGFQRDHSLKQTGMADRETVAFIKKTAQKTLDRDRQKQENKAKEEQYKKWAAIGGGAGILNLLIAISLFFSTRAKQRDLRELCANVVDYVKRKP